MLVQLPPTTGLVDPGFGPNASTGYVEVTLTGRNFGPTAETLAARSIDRVNTVRATYGPTNATGRANSQTDRYSSKNCTVVEDDTTMVCFSTEGVGKVGEWKWWWWWWWRCVRFCLFCFR